MNAHLFPKFLLGSRSNTQSSNLIEQFRKTQYVETEFYLEEFIFNIPFINFCSMNTTHPTIANGKICYVELPSNDPKASSKFYKQIFGWNIRTRGDGATSFDDGAGEVSGAWVKGRKAAAEVGMVVYIMVDNIEDAIKSIEKHGGKIVQPLGMDAPELTARFADLDGNIFGLYQEPTQ